MKNIINMPVWLTLKNIIHIVVLFLFASCSHDSSHLDTMADDVKGDKDAVGIFALTTDSDMPIEDIHIYGFASTGDLKVHDYHTTAKEAANSMTALDATSYTFIMVVNGGADFTPPTTSRTNEELPNIMFIDFIKWLEENKSDYPTLLTGMETVEIKKDVINYIYIGIKEGTEALKLSTLRLNLTFPDGNLPPLTRSQKLNGYVVENYKLRAVTEIYQKGTKTKYVGHSAILDNHTFDVNIPKGDYDVLVWADYVPVESKSHRTDHYYTTTNLGTVMFNPERPYTANTDGRDASSLNLAVTITSDDVTETPVILDRPFAKFLIVATDVERYRKFEDINNYPPLEELSITISYEGYTANTFDVRGNVPINSTTGVKFTTPSPQDITTTTASLACDYLFVNGTSIISYATITINDKNGKKITQVSGVEIKVRRNQLTTITGDFLTAGVITGGIEIDTDWDDDIDFEF